MITWISTPVFLENFFAFIYFIVRQGIPLIKIQGAVQTLKKIHLLLSPFLCQYVGLVFRVQCSRHQFVNAVFLASKWLFFNFFYFTKFLVLVELKIDWKFISYDIEIKKFLINYLVFHKNIGWLPNILILSQKII